MSIRNRKPIVARGMTLGAMTFVSLQPSRRYGEADLTFAEDLGRRAGVAVGPVALGHVSSVHLPPHAGPGRSGRPAGRRRQRL